MSDLKTICKFCFHSGVINAKDKRIAELEVFENALDECIESRDVAYRRIAELEAELLHMTGCRDTQHDIATNLDAELAALKYDLVNNPEGDT